MRSCRRSRVVVLWLIFLCRRFIVLTSRSMNSSGSGGGVASLIIWSVDISPLSIHTRLFLPAGWCCFDPTRNRGSAGGQDDGERRGRVDGTGGGGATTSRNGINKRCAEIEYAFARWMAINNDGVMWESSHRSSETLTMMSSSSLETVSSS